MRPDTTKLLEENIDRTFFDINCSKIFLDPPPRVMRIKPKINKLDFIKIKNFCPLKDTINKSEKATNGMGENICKSQIWQGINIQNRKRTPL